MENNEESETKTERVLIRITPTYLSKINEFIKVSGHKDKSEFFREAGLRFLRSSKKIESEYDKVMNFISAKFDNFEMTLKEMLNTSEVTKPIVKERTTSAKLKARSIMDSLVNKPKTN